MTAQATTWLLMQTNPTAPCCRVRPISSQVVAGAGAAPGQPLPPAAGGLCLPRVRMISLCAGGEGQLQNLAAATVCDKNEEHQQEGWWPLHV